jgi:hypothetical protein
MYIAYKILANAKMDNDDYYTRTNFQGLSSGGLLLPILLKGPIHILRKIILTSVPSLPFGLQIKLPEVEKQIRSRNPHKKKVVTESEIAIKIG